MSLDLYYAFLPDDFVVSEDPFIELRRGYYVYRPGYFVVGRFSAKPSDRTRINNKQTYLKRTFVSSDIDEQYTPDNYKLDFIQRNIKEGNLPEHGQILSPNLVERIENYIHLFCDDLMYGDHRLN